MVNEQVEDEHDDNEDTSTAKEDHRREHGGWALLAQATVLVHIVLLCIANPVVADSGRA